MNLFKFFIFTSLFLFWTSTHAAPTVSGIFMVVKGDVKIKRQNDLIKAKVSSNVTQGDTVISGVDSRAKIVMADKNVIHISPNTEVKIETYTNSSTSKNVELNLKQGKIRNNVEQAYDGEKDKFIIKTPTAVAGVRGTQFITSFDQSTQQTQIITLHGRVELTNIPTSPSSAPTTVIVNPGQISTSSAHQAPAAPQTLPPEQIRTLDRETAVQERQLPTPGAATTGETSGRQNSGHENRVVDRQDQSPDAFKKVPALPNTGQLLPPRPTFQPPPPPVNNLPADAIRQQNEKSHVTIKPQ